MQISASRCQQIRKKRKRRPERSLNTNQAVVDANENTSAADRSKSSPNIFTDDEQDTSQPGVQEATASGHKYPVAIESGTSEATKAKLEEAANARAEFERRREKRKLLRKRRRESKKKKRKMTVAQLLRGDTN